MTGAARKILLPHFAVTEVSSENDEGAIAVTIPRSELTSGDTYHVRPKKAAGASERRDGKPRWVEHRFNLFPVIPRWHGCTLGRGQCLCIVKA